MFFMSCFTNFKNIKLNKNILDTNIYSYNNEKMIILSPELSISYRSLINFLNFNKLEINIDNIIHYLDLFLENYKFCSGGIYYRIKQKYKKHINNIVNDKYWDLFYATLTNFTPMIYLLYNLCKKNKTDWKLIFVIIFFIICYIVFKLFQIELEEPILNEIKYMKELKNILLNTSNINKICLTGNYNNRCGLLSNLLTRFDVKNNTNCDINEKVLCDFSNDVSELNLLINNINNNLDASNNNLDVSNNNLDASNNNLDASNNNLDVSNNNLDASNSNLNASNNNLDVSNNNLDVSNNNLDVSNNNLDVSNNNLDASNNNLDASNNNLDASNNNLDASNNNLDASNNNLDASNNNLFITKRNYKKNKTSNNKTSNNKTSNNKTSNNKTSNNKTPKSKTINTTKSNKSNK